MKEPTLKTIKAPDLPGLPTGSLNDKPTKDEVEKIIETKDTLVVTYCSNLKCGASNKLNIHLKKTGL